MSIRNGPFVPMMRKTLCALIMGLNLCACQETSSKSADGEPSVQQAAIVIGPLLEQISTDRSDGIGPSWRTSYRTSRLKRALLALHGEALQDALDRALLEGPEDSRWAVILALSGHPDPLVRSRLLAILDAPQGTDTSIAALMALCADPRFLVDCEYALCSNTMLDAIAQLLEEMGLMPELAREAFEARDRLDLLYVSSLSELDDLDQAGERAFLRSRCGPTVVEYMRRRSKKADVELFRLLLPDFLVPIREPLQADVKELLLKSVAGSADMNLKRHGMILLGLRQGTRSEPFMEACRSCLTADPAGQLAPLAVFFLVLDGQSSDLQLVLNEVERIPGRDAFVDALRFGLSCRQGHSRVFRREANRNDSVVLKKGDDLLLRLESCLEK